MAVRVEVVSRQRRSLEVVADSMWDYSIVYVFLLHVPKIKKHIVTIVLLHAKNYQMEKVLRLRRTRRGFRDSSQLSEKYLSFLSAQKHHNETNRYLKVYDR